MSIYSIGFLRRRGDLRFSGGEIVAVEDFDDANQWVSEVTNSNGFIYPPPVVNLASTGERIPNSERIAHLHRLPASHRFHCSDELSPNDAHRPGASLILQLVAYLYETWLQFDDWWFDARVPMRQHGLCSSNATAERFLSQSYQEWRKWPDRVRQRFVNTLFMFNRAPSYEWDWEHFAMQYMVFDALYKTATEIGIVPKAKSHPARLETVCRELGLAHDATGFAEFVRLRNDLLHEALWDGGKPGTAGGGVAIMCQYHLRRLNQRLIPAILQFKNEFVSSNWWTMGRFDFTDPK